jgi:hypothetical protein
MDGDGRHRNLQVKLVVEGMSPRMFRDTGQHCIICGKPGVESHLAPKSLAHLLRSGDKNLSVIGLDGSRVKVQGGVWDPGLLCDEHESALNDADTYGVEFARAVREMPIASPGIYRLPNPKPPQLKRFLLSVVWRHDNSGRMGTIRNGLGPYEESVRRAVFESATIEAPVFLRRVRTMAGKAPVEIAATPALARFGERNCWKITFGWLDAFVKLDKGRWPTSLEHADASVSDPAIVLVGAPEQLTDNPHLRELLKVI